MNPRDTKIMLAIVVSAIAASIVPLWATFAQYDHVDIIAGAEDDCAYTHGGYHLDAVIGMDDGAIHHVICRYR